MRKTVSIEGVVSILFVILLFVPLIVSIIEEDLLTSDSEKRKLAVLPEFAWSSEFFEKFPEMFETYYEDHFGLRGDIVRLHNYVLLKIFNASPSKKVVVGSDNWFFYNGDGSINDFIGQYKYTTLTLEKFRRRLEDRVRWLETIGSHYVFMPVPNKETVYGEHLPRRIRDHRAPTKYEQIVGYLENKGFRGVLDSQKILLDLKPQKRVFLQTDSHWNHDGIYGVYQELITRMQQWFSDMHPLRQKEEKEWYQDFSGDLAIYMNLRGIVTEDAPKTSIIEECEPIPERRLMDLKKDPFYDDLTTQQLPVVAGCNEKKYKAVVIHDSFGNYLRPYLTQHFKRVVYINHMNFEKARRIIEIEKPHMVIDQRVARNIQRALRPDPELETIRLRPFFDGSEDQTTLIGPDGWEERMLEMSGASIHAANNATLVEFNVAQASVSFEFKSDTDLPESTAVRLSLEGFQDSSLVLCYKSTGTSETEQQCTIREIRQGSNELLFRLVFPEMQGKLAIYLKRPGKIALKELMVSPEVETTF